MKTYICRKGILKNKNYVVGYFSNGTEGEMYESKWCRNCVHVGDEDNGCPVWMSHFAFAYGAKCEAKDILDTLIPRTKDGIWNEKCGMFFDIAKVQNDVCTPELPL